MPSGSVFASLTGTAAIAAAKFTAASFSGSSSLFAEGVHSAVNCGNSALMWLGQRRSRKPPDEQHPFGYGMEVYFWTLVVALVLFAVAGGVTVAKGVGKVLHPGELAGAGWSYAVLAVSAAFAVRSWWAAWREFRAGQGDRPFGEAVRKAKDPTTLTVLFEGSAALLGLTVAFLGLLLAQQLDEPRIDGAASVLIGLLMAGVAVGLVYQCKQLLVGESATRELKEDLREMAEDDDAVERVEDVLSMQLAPDDVMAILSVKYRAGVSAVQAANAAGRLAVRAREEHPEVRHLFLQPAPVAAAAPAPSRPRKPSRQASSGPRESALERFSRLATDWSGSSLAFALATLTIVVWLVTGPVFNYSDTWQLVINTGTTVVTFLMVFLIQRSQNKDSRAVHLKLNEVVAAVAGASNRLINVEGLTEDEIKALHGHYGRLVELAKADARLTQSHSVEEATERHLRKKGGANGCRKKRAAGRNGKKAPGADG